MNERWDLTPLYQSFTDEKWTRDLEALTADCRDFAAFSREIGALPPKEALRGYIDRMEALSRRTEDLALYASLRQAADTRDPEAGSAMGQILALNSTLAGPDAVCKAYLSTLPELQKELEGDEVLEAYRYLFCRMQEQSRHLLDGKCEEILARMEISGSTAWSDLQSRLTSSVAVEYQGKKTNLSSIRNLAYDPDPAVRKAAYEAELKCYPQIEDSVAFALNSIKLEAINEAELRSCCS